MNGHGGKRANTGGKREGAGRKPKAREGYNETMRGILEDVVTPEAWRRICTVTLRFAEAGDKDARNFLRPWVLGAEPKELVVKGDDDAPMKVIVEYVDGERKAHKAP